MLDTNLDVVQRFYETMHALDTEGMLGALSEDFVGHVSAGLPGGFGGEHRGRERMLEDVWEPVYARFQSLPHPERFYDAGPDTVIVVGEYRGTVPTTGRELHASFAHVLRLRDGMITELQQITDTSAWSAGLSNIDVAQQVFDAVRARDGGKLLAVYAEDIVICDDPSLPYGGEFRGHDGATAHGLGFVQAWDQYQDRDDRDMGEVLIDGGSRVIALWRLRARRGARRLDQPTLSVLTVSNRAVTRLEMFHQDTRELTAFLDPATSLH